MGNPVRISPESAHEISDRFKYPSRVSWRAYVVEFAVTNPNIDGGDDATEFVIFTSIP